MRSTVMEPSLLLSASCLKASKKHLSRASSVSLPVAMTRTSHVGICEGIEMAGNFAETIQIDSTSFCKCTEDMSVQPKPTQKHPKASSYMMLQSARSRKTHDLQEGAP